MTLTESQVVELIESGDAKKLVLARKRAKKINMHITGKNVKDYLEKLDGYENAGQKVIREKLVKSNRALFSFILRPTDKIFTAKGGSINYNLSQNRIDYLKDNVNEVADGLDIKKYLKKVVKKHYIIDPNGIIFIDIDQRGKLETHVVTTEELFWYDNNGNTVNAIIFAPFRTEREEDRNKKFYRVIDQETDRIFVNEGGKIYEDKAKTLDNYFGFVPAIIMGDEKNPNDDIYESILADIIDEADEMLRDVSVKTVHKLAHAYPKYWEYEQACTQCEGEGVVSTVINEVVEQAACSSCGGDGVKKKTNPSDAMSLRAPQDGEHVLAPNVAGFVSPDIQTMEFYERSIEKAKNSMFQAMWGTTYEQGGKRETATGRFLDAQPVQDRLGDFSDTFAKFHKFMLDCYGKVVLLDRKYESSVSYGKRYILEAPDDLLDKYVEVSRENVSELGILDLRNRYFEAEYQNDPIELVKRKKLAKIEPFPTMKVLDVMKEVSIPENDRLKKLYYSSWVCTLTDPQVIFATEEQLRNNLDEYITNKQLKQSENVKS